MKGAGRAAAAALLVAIAIGAVAYWSPRISPLSDAMDAPPPPLRLPLRDPRVVIRKKARELALYDGTTLLRRYRVVLGASVEGHKEREGDRRTPEGAYYVCSRNDASRFHKFMGLSYPGPADAERGLRARRISKAEHDAILETHRKRECPPWKTALGGEVGIHGGGIDRDWTLGCIAVTNEAIDELWSALKMGDPVEIRP